MSVHKSQGNEYPIVVLLGFIEYGWMLQRRLYYTAITRAANYLICMGETLAFKKAVEQDKFYKRQTYLKQRLVVE
jgi:exodeoxyribonuclease V alpha subunit